MILFYWLKQSKIWKKQSELHWKTFDVKMNAKKTNLELVSKDVTLTKVTLKIDGDIIKQTDKYIIHIWDEL